LEDRTVLSVVYTPAQVVTAYGFNQIHFGTVPGDGRGQTIALVDAYADPHITSDLNAFSKQFGLPQVNVAGGPTFTVNDLSGGTPDPTGGNWEVETALDVEWAHAVAPQANILLVEAKDDLQDPNTGTLTSLMAAVNTAASTGGVAAVSMSWGVPEYPNEVRDDAAFAATAHPGVTFVAASGDSGAGVGFPSISPNVLSVGGTSLRIGANGSYQGETAWGNGRWSGLLGGSGGGRSAYEAQPSYQAGVVPASMSRPHGGSAVRTNPDVAYVADPNTGVVVYDNGNFYGVGGTSAGAPQWAALVAIADQGAALQGKGPLTGATQTLPAIYAAAQSDFHDVTRGSNGYSATVGYDLVTGRGSPKAPLVVNDLIKAATGAAAAVVTPAVGSSSITLMTTQTMQAPKKLPAPTPAPAASPHDVLSPNSSQTTGMTSPLPVSGTPAGATSATTTTVTVIVVAPPVVTSSAILPTAATVTAITAAPPTAAAFTTTVTGLAPQATFVTGNSGGGGSGDATLAPAVGQPGAPVDGNQAPAPDNPMPMPAVPDTGAPEAGAVLGDFGGGALAGDAADGAAAFGWDEGEYTALPDSGAAVAALLMALAYCGAGRTPRQEQDEGRRDWLAC
jgi:subtilase family serine protease